MDDSNSYIVFRETVKRIAKMSSLGNQWRMIRHYLSSSNLPAEVEKLIQKIKPATPKQWDGEYITLNYNGHSRLPSEQP